MSAIRGIWIRYLDLPDGGRCCFIGNGHADDFTAGLFQLLDLFDRGLDVARIRGGHGLDDDGRIAADLNTAEKNGSCFFSSDDRTQKNTLSLRVTLVGITAWHKRTE